MGGQASTPMEKMGKDGKRRIERSWAKFNEGDIIENVAHVYFRLFLKSPDIQDLFSFNTPEEINEQNFRHNETFCNHLQKFVEILNSVVENLDNLSELQTTFKELGERHHTYGVTMNQFNLIGDGVTYALERKLGSHFTKDTRKVWEILFDFIEQNMEDGMREKSKKDAKVPKS